MKFTDRGRIKLCAELVDINDIQRKVKMRFSVVDTGIGVDLSVAPSLFQSFTRGAKVKSEGTGLELSISQRWFSWWTARFSTQLKKGVAFGLIFHLL